jgi:hypothetical protein
MTRQVRNFAFRLIIIVVILLTLGRIYGAVLVAPTLPAISRVIEFTEKGFHVDRIYVTNKQNNTVIQLKVIPTQPMIIGPRVLMPRDNLFFEPSILVGSVLQPIIVLLTILFAWPAKSIMFFPMRLLLSVPATLALFATNAPLGLIGAMWDFREYFPNMEVHLLVYWNDFLQTGGPLVMSIAAGVLVVTIADHWTRSLKSKLLVIKASA